MKYRYEDLSEKQFEALIVLLCQRLLGMSVQGFSSGPDGGRDAKFVGTAELLPSRAARWVGTVIIQAKHTNGHNRHFLESDFFSKTATSTIIANEIPRIKKLRKANDLDHYMLFANRRLSANGENTIRAHLSKMCGIPKQSIYLGGTEELEKWFRNFPEVPDQANIDPVDSPLIISPDELAEVVQALASHMEVVKAAFDDPPIRRVSYERKNKLNNMTEEYARQQRKKYLKDTSLVQTFLAAPENIEMLRLYETITDEFQLKITAKRRDYQTFDEVMEYLAALLFDRDPILSQTKHKRLTRVVLFYMYWNCDIGEKDDAETVKALPSRQNCN